MTMDLVQVRLPLGLIAELDALVHKGLYASKSDAIRDALRRLVLDRQIGSIPDTGDSVKEVRALRKKLSRQKVDVATLNRL